jgi:hypothetical protein
MRKWLKLSIEDRALYCKILMLTGIIRLIILVVPFRYISKYLGENGYESPMEIDQCEIEASTKIGSAVERVSKHTVWESKCIVQAVCAKLLLRKMGISNTLYLGVRKNEYGRLAAHAWLRAGNKIVTGKRYMEGYKAVYCFGDK